MTEKEAYIIDNKRRSYEIDNYQILFVRNMFDDYRHEFRAESWQKGHLLKYNSWAGGVGQKLNGERVNFQALPALCVRSWGASKIVLLT